MAVGLDDADVVAAGTATAARVLNRDDVGGKTGSTNDHRDAWFSGFGGPYVTTVWVGRDDFQSLGYREYGGTALPIWISEHGSGPERPTAAPTRSTGRHGQGQRQRQRPAVAGVEGGITEWVKAEDLQRMEEDTLAIPDTDTQPSEESFDIF